MKSKLILTLGSLMLIALQFNIMSIYGIKPFTILIFVIVHFLWVDFYLTLKRIYGLKQWDRQPQCYVGDYFLYIFIINTMATFKIKLGDKAAFLNRMEKQGETISSEEIKDNKLEDYFKVDIVEPKQLEVAKTILKQSPKINTIKEMKKSLTKDQLKEMIRQELSGVLAEKKKMKGEGKEEKIKLTLNEYTGDKLSYDIGAWAIKNIPAIADFFKGTPTGNGQEIADLGLTITGLATVGTGLIGTGLAMYKDQIVDLAKKLKNAMTGGMKEGDDPELARLAAALQAQA